MAIKVYKGGSWVNTTGLSAIGKADRLSIGQTDTSLSESDKSYYLSFVDANNPHGSREYESFYTGIGLTFSPISKSLSVDGNIYSNGILYLNGTSTNDNGDIHSNGGLDGNFGIFNEGAGPLWLSVKDSNNTTLVGIVSFSSESGTNFAARQSIFQSNINPRVTDTYDIGKSATERWNNVYANCFHGDGTGLTGTGFWEPDTKENLKAGTDAGKCINDHTCYNIFIGYEAGKNTCSTAGGAADDGIADENIFIGKCSGHSNTTGGYNIFGGSNSGFCNTSGGCNVAFGKEAGYCVTGSCNIFLGLYAGRCSTTGTDNIFMGYKAGFNNAACTDNIFLGFYSGTRTTGKDNIALGYSSLLGGATGPGIDPLLGQGNVAIGKDTGKLLGNGAHSYNVFLGYQAGHCQTAGSCNVVIGYNANTASCTGDSELSIGINANNWLSGDSSFNIKPGKGIIDCTGSCGTEGQVLTSRKVAGPPDNYYVKWETNVSQSVKADKIKITDDIDADDNSKIHYIHFGEKTSDYDDVKVDSNGLSYYQARDDEKWVGIGTTSPHDSTGNAGGLTLSRGDGQVRLVMKNNDTGHSDGDGSHIVIGSKDFTFENRTSEGHLHWSTNIAATGATADIGKRMTLTPEGHVGIGTTNPISVEIATSLETNDNVLAVGIVTANEYYGTFKGTIDPDVTITLDKIEASTGTLAQVVDTGTDGHFKVLTEGTERLRITPGGDIVVHHNSQNPTHSTSSGSIFLTPPASTNPNRGIMWSNTSDTHYVKLEPNVIDGLTINGFSGVVFATGSRTNSTWRERFRIDSSGRIGLLDDTTNGTLKSDNFGTDNQVLTSKGPNSAAVWQTVSGIPASTSTQVKVTKTVSQTKLYLTGVTANDDGTEATTVDKTLYQKNASTNSTFYIDTSSDTLYAKKIRGEVVAASTWPDIQGDLTIQTNHLIPSSNVALTNNVITGGQNLGGPSNKWAKVYAQEFDGHLGGTADKAEQLEVQKNETSGTGHYFGMITGAGENGTPTNQTFYTDTALYYNPSSDILTALNIEVSTKLHVKGNTELGDQLSDTVTWNGRSGTIQPSGTVDSENYTDKNLGSTSYKWNNVYAKTFNGAFSGTASQTNLVQVSGSNQNKDLSLTFIDWVSTDGDPAYKGLKFDADRNLTYNALSNVLTVPNLAISGITTLGNALNSDKTIFKSKVDSNIVPLAPASGDAADKHNLGSPNDIWGIVYATEFSGPMSGSASQVNTQSTTTIDGYVTFVQYNHDSTDPTVNLESTVYTNSLLTYNSTAGSEILTVSGQLKVSKDAEFDEDVTLGSAAADDKVTFKSKIAAPLDNNSKGSILPLTPGTVDGSGNPLAGIDLGGTSNYWRKIYAREFVGAITGNADTATALNPGAAINLTSGTYDATHDFSSAGTTKFTGASDYEVTAQLNTTGVTATTYGNNTGTSYARFEVDAKGRIKSASTQAISLTGLTATNAEKLEVTERDNFTTDYIPFVIGAPSSTATAKTFYSDDNLRYRSASDMLITSKISSDGSFPSAAGYVATTKLISTGPNVYGWEWSQGTASGIGRNYTLPLTTSTGSSGTATWTLTDNVTPTPNTNAITLNAGDGLTISSASPGTTGGSFTIAMDTSSNNTAFLYKNGSTDPSNTGKVAATLQIYPSGSTTGGGTGQVVTLTPGTGIKFTSQSAQALTIESDATYGASNVATTLATDNIAHYLTFVTGNAANTSKTLYQDSDGLTYNPSTNTLTTGNLTVTGNTTLGDNNGTDIVTWNAKSGTILPTNNSQNLGSQNDPWGTVFANTITGTLTVNTSDNQVLYTDTSSGSALVAGSDLFTYDGSILEVADAASAANYCQLTRDGGIEICRTNPNTGGSGGAFVDFRDDPALSQDYIARIQLATHMAGNLWNNPHDRGGLLFETGGTNYRHMLLTKDGVLGITRGTSASAIVANDGSSSWTTGFVPGIPRDTNLNDAHNVNERVVLDANGLLMLRANPEDDMTLANSREGGQVVLNNSNDLIGFSIDVYGKTSGNSTLRIIDEKSLISGNDGRQRGTQRFAMNRNGAITFKTYSGAQDGSHDASNVDADYGLSGQFLKSQGAGAIPIWADVTASSALKVNVRYHTGGFATYTPTTNTKFIRVQVIGPGGGGGGLTADNEEPRVSGSGGGGGYLEAYFDIADTGTMVWQAATGGPGGSPGNDGSTGGECQFYTNYNTSNQICMKGSGGGGGKRQANVSSYRNDFNGFGGNVSYTRGIGGSVVQVFNTPPQGNSEILPSGQFIYMSDGAPGQNSWTSRYRTSTYVGWQLTQGGVSGMGGSSYGRGGNGFYDFGESRSGSGSAGGDGVVIVTEFGDF